MDQIKKLLARLSLAQKISLVAAALLVAAGLFGFAQWRREGDFRPLYTGLAAEDAGIVVQKLKESGTEYRLAENGGTVLAPSTRVAELRLQLAASGLPKSGRMGFEIFDKTSFGVTDFAEHINYRRALEGELERSMVSLAEVEKALATEAGVQDSACPDDTLKRELQPGDLKKLQAALAVLDDVTKPLANLLMDRAMEAMLRKRGLIQ